MKKALLVVLLLTQPLFANPPLPEARSESEALLVRRIIDFWRDKEYPFAKSQIRTYLNNYSDSPFIDHFNAMLGDMALHEKGYQEALDYYSQVSDAGVASSIQSKRWQALYQLERYDELYKEIVAPSSEEESFYFAEAAFRKGLYKEALPFYEPLVGNNNFGPHAKLAIAEINRLLGNQEVAAKLYLEIAEIQNDDKEEILFHAAALMSTFDVEKAALHFASIARGSSSRASDAAYQWLLILAGRGEWDTIAHERNLWLKKIAPALQKEAYYYLGMVAFDRGDHHQAIIDLQKALDEGISSPHDKPALEALLSSSAELHNCDLCERSYALLTERYPDQRPGAGYLRATTYRGERALTLFEELLQQFPNHPVAEKAGVEKVRLLMGEKQWKEAHAAVLTYLKLYPKSNRRGEMFRLAIALSQMQAAEGEAFAQLAEDIERAFAARIFHGKEKREKQELLTRAYLKLDRVNAALGILHEMEDPDPLLFTQCYIKEGSSPEKVIAFGERALERHPEQEKIHLHLFNAYLELAQKQPEESLSKRAAAHLEAIIDLYPVTLENRLWLAHYFAKEQDQRALPLLESLLQTESNLKRFVEEGLTLARLYQKGGEYAKALALAERMTAPEAKLIAAEVYSVRGEKEKAERLFMGLEESAHLPIAYAATLHLARLRFEKEPEKSLKKLHELMTRKSIATEPIHLEAALDYAELKASLAPKQSRQATLLGALMEMKEEFTTCRDISSKDYHESRRLMGEKEQIYQAYMRYLDARIYLLQGNKSAARAVFSTLRQGKYAVSTYLVERAIKGMYE